MDTGVPIGSPFLPENPCAFFCLLFGMRRVPLGVPAVLHTLTHSFVSLHARARLAGSARQPLPSSSIVGLPLALRTQQHMSFPRARFASGMCEERAGDSVEESLVLKQMAETTNCFN
jgi:hypothetical protein